jgi:NAD-dependent SIR2 family protein deacetylase
MFIKNTTATYTKDCSDNIKKLSEALSNSDAVLIGAGSGLSSAAGYAYSGERFEKNFADFKQKYGIKDMYSGGFYPYETLEEYWTWWSRHIYINRYDQPQNPLFHQLYDFINGKNYFILTTNVDHLFQINGFDKERLFYTQGDYGLFQCVDGCGNKTYDNESQVRQMLAEQKNMKIPTELIPRCPLCGKPMTMNLRCDFSFVQDIGWYAAQKRYNKFLEENAEKRILLLELGVGSNTPSIIKYPFWRFTLQNPNSTYACINAEDTSCPKEIKERSICIEADIDKIFSDINKIK